MDNARRIATLYARRRRLILGLQDFERRAGVYRLTISMVEDELWTLVSYVPAFKPRNQCPLFTSRELIRGYYDALRQANGRELTADEIVTFLIQRKGLEPRDTALRTVVRRRVLEAVRRIRQRSVPMHAASSRRNRPMVGIAAPDEQRRAPGPRC